MGTQTSTETVQVPDYIEKASKDILKRSDAVTSRPYEPYPGQRLADFTPDTMAGFEATRANQGSYAPFFNAAGIA